MRRRRHGAAYLFDTDGGQQLFKLLASDGMAFDNFGRSVAISGNTAIVGAPGQGAAYLFDTTTGQQIAKLAPGGAGYGQSVAISGDMR